MIMKIKCFAFTMFVTSFFMSCIDSNSNFVSFVEKHCNFNECDSCELDLRLFFGMDYDTMYVFGEYTQLQGVQLVLGDKNYQEKDVFFACWFFGGGFI